MRTGQRRYAGTDAGGNYQQLLAHLADGEFADPGATERTLGDYLDPTRSGRVVWLVNAVSREVGTDAAGWTIDRIVSMVAGLEREAAQQSA